MTLINIITKTPDLIVGILYLVIICISLLFENFIPETYLSNIEMMIMVDFVVVYAFQLRLLIKKDDLKFKDRNLYDIKDLLLVVILLVTLVQSIYIFTGIEGVVIAIVSFALRCHESLSFDSLMPNKEYIIFAVRLITYLIVVILFSSHNPEHLVALAACYYFICGGAIIYINNLYPEVEGDEFEEELE